MIVAYMTHMYFCFICTFLMTFNYTIFKCLQIQCLVLYLSSLCDRYIKRVDQMVPQVAFKLPQRI